MTPARLGNTGVVQVPGIRDHDFEVLVVVNGHTDISVVFLELFAGDDVIGSRVVAHVQMRLEGGEPLLENLYLGLFTGQYIGVLATVVESCNVVNVNLTIAITVKLIKSLVDQESA